MKNHVNYNDEKEEKKKAPSLSKKVNEQILEGRKLNLEETKNNIESTKDQLNNKKAADIDSQRMNKYLSQRHLYDHKKKKASPLVNITNKNLQLEYISEVKYLFINFIFIILLSIIIFVQSLLILHNYKNFTEVILSLIFSAFSIFNSIFLITELYRDALRDQFRNKLFRLFSIFLYIFLFCLFFSK